jgi:dihydroxyacid dehydratase/phosphogluconate dehydratase
LRIPELVHQEQTGEGIRARQIRVRESFLQMTHAYMTRPDWGVIAAVFVVDCGASGVAYEVQPMEDAVGMGVVGMLPAVATSRTRTYTRTTWVRTSRWVDTAERMMGVRRRVQCVKQSDVLLMGVD